MKMVYLMPLLALMLLAGCAEAPPGGVPKAAEDKYAELSARYADGLGAILNKCTKGNSVVYSVIGSTGFAGITYHYDSSGKQLAVIEWDDMVEPGEPLPPANPEDYECAAVKQSKPQPG